MISLGSFVFVALFLSVRADESTSINEEDNVLVLNTKNFDYAVKTYKYLLVEFYAPWCGHCKALAPEYVAAAKQLHEEGSEIRLAKVDATVETAIAEKHEVSGYPTLKFYKNGKFSEYKGGRKGPLIAEWLKKKTGPSLLTLDNVDEAKKFIDTHQIAIIAFAKSENVKKTIDEVSDSFEEGVDFAITSSPALFTEFQIAADNQLVLFRKFDDPRLEMPDFTTETTAEQIKTFIAGNQLPLVVEFSAEVAQKVFGGEVKKHVLLFESSKADTAKANQDNLREVAKDFKGKVICLHINTDEEDNERILDFFGIKKDELPALRAVVLGKDLSKFKPDTKDFSVAALKEFIGKFVDGKLKAHLLSQELPADWDKEPVKVLVSSNLNQFATDPSKAVFVEFYAPWCGHCKALKPIWDQLGEAYKSSPDIIIGKVDATANEFDEFKVQSFPTLKFWPKADSSNPTPAVIDYTGDRTLEALKKFVDSNGKEDGKPSKEEGDEAEDDEEHEAEEAAEKKEGGDEAKKDEL
jgi:protein disulfide-isomerase A1